MTMPVLTRLSVPVCVAVEAIEALVKTPVKAPVVAPAEATEEKPQSALIPVVATGVAVLVFVGVAMNKPGESSERVQFFAQQQHEE